MSGYQHISSAARQAWAALAGLVAALTLAACAPTPPAPDHSIGYPEPDTPITCPDGGAYDPTCIYPMGTCICFGPDGAEWAVTPDAPTPEGFGGCVRWHP